MINTEIENLEYDRKTLSLQEPEFSDVEPDLEEIQRKASEMEYKSLIVIGNGGSVTSFRALYYAFIDQIELDVHIVTTPEPDFLNRISKNTTSENTLVMPISKSGETTTVLESLLYFMKRDYPVMAVTSDNHGALRKIVEREGLDWIEHKEVGGRFSGLTETALMPAAVCGLDIEEVRKGGEELYREYEDTPNKASELAKALYEAEKQGFNQILTPFYSTRLYGFYPLIVQLMHETVCKKGKGQSVFGDLGPEYQHHTNQRLFGGRENIIPMFISSETHEKEKLDIPKELLDIGVRGRQLGDLEGKTLSSAVKSEAAGVKKALNEREIPYASIEIKNIDYKSAGRFMAFFQYLSVYSAQLRSLNPYNQPDVEMSKEIGFKERFK